MRTKNKISMAMVLALLFIVATLPFTANAASVNPHWYAVQRLTATNTGVYTSITNDQEDLSHVSNSFINKETWVGFSNGGWIEAGTTLGPVDNSDGYVADWHGHFFAYRDGNGIYHERNVGSEYPTGTHNFQISRDTDGGTTNWTVYVDFTRVGTVPSITSTTAIDQDVGIESSDSSNSFTSGTYASAMQYRNTSGTWTNWSSSSASKVNLDSNGARWVSSYSSSNNRITFTH